jgi:hypothetical protein
VRTEVYSYVAGTLLRRDGLDQGTGKAADLLLDELAEHAGLANRLVTSLSFTAEEETLNRMTNLVRLRFPGAGVWDLPVVAHEFGHYVMRELPHVMDSDSRPIMELVSTLAANDSAQHIEELFADVCATYALGPAYPLSCAGLRVPHGDLDAQCKTHPAWRYRISAMIETLRWIAEQAGTRGIAIDRWVQPVWDALSDGPAPAAGSADGLKYQVHRMTGELRRHAGGLQYDMGDNAYVVAAELTKHLDEVRLPVGCTVAHVLDGVWRWRLDHPGKDSVTELAQVSAIVITLCERARTTNQDPKTMSHRSA